MDRFSFSGARIKDAGIEYKDKIGVVAKIKMSAGLTDQVIQAMEWGDPPSWSGKMSLDGVLLGRLIDLHPEQLELRSHRLQFKCLDIQKFQCTRDEDTGDHELTFEVRSVEKNVIRVVDEYLNVIGLGPSSMEVMVETQEKLDLAPEVTLVQRGKKGKGIGVVQ